MRQKLAHISAIVHISHKYAKYCRLFGDWFALNTVCNKSTRRVQPSVPRISEMNVKCVTQASRYSEENSALQVVL